MPLIAVDVGNSRIKWGLFTGDRLVQVATLPLHDAPAYDRQFDNWQVPSGTDWSIASVNLDGSDYLAGWLRQHGIAQSHVFVLDDTGYLPLRVELDEPGAVGMDRLLDAVAVNARRPAGRPAIVVDAGSAITVDAISADGAFVGGTIAIGLALAARGLHEFTCLLPLMSVSRAPQPLGKSTAEAIHSGLFWGTVGAIKELISRVSEAMGGNPIVYLTGGDGELVAPHLGRPVELAPELTLHGIQLAYEHVRSSRPTT